MTDFFSAIEFSNFGPIKKGELKLTRLHALIGPNDSGKSIALRGLRLASRLAGKESPAAGDEVLLGREGIVTALRGGVQGECRGGAAGTRRVRFHHAGETTAPVQSGELASWLPARTLRLDPDFLRRATPLIDDTSPLDFVDERGTGLGALLDAIFARDVQTRLTLEASFRTLFPTVKGFRLFTDAGGRRVGVRLQSGEDIDADLMSEGMLYFLAFSILPWLSPVSMLLIEEPENGLHPARIAEVMAVLRKISETTQVVLATHSPLVVNELQPDEVTLVTRTVAEGTRFTPITQTPNFEKRTSAFALGELWLNYADGVSEAPLFKTGS